MLNKEGFNAWADGYDRSTARSDAGKVTFIQSLLPLLRESGVIYIGDVAFDTRAELEACRAQSGTRWDKDEIYFVYDELKKVFPAMTFDRLSPPVPGYCRCGSEAAYSTEPEHPWADKPEFSVFRHASNKKWFALFMTVKASLLGLPGAEEVPVLNLKADPRLIGPQREKPGFFPAYHMNKEHWITAALDGSAPEDEIKILLAMSYDLTAMTRAFRKNTILP